MKYLGKHIKISWVTQYRVYQRNILSLFQQINELLIDWISFGLKQCYLCTLLDLKATYFAWFWFVLLRSTVTKRVCTLNNVFILKQQRFTTRDWQLNEENYAICAGTDKRRMSIYRHFSNFLISFLFFSVSVARATNSCPRIRSWIEYSLNWTKPVTHQFGEQKWTVFLTTRNNNDFWTEFTISHIVGYKMQWLQGRETHLSLDNGFLKNYIVTKAGYDELEIKLLKNATHSLEVVDLRYSLNRAKTWSPLEVLPGAAALENLQREILEKTGQRVSY